MSFFKHFKQRSSFLWLGLLLLLIISSSPSTGHAQTESETSSTTSDSSEEIEQLLQTADTHFEKKEFTAAYDFYLRVLGSDPGNQHARENVYAIIKTYKTLMEAAQQAGDADQAALPQQKYRNFVRDFLKILTTQLKKKIQQYSELIAAEKTGEDVKEEIVPVLNHIIQILEDLKTVYKDFSQGDSGTAKMSERIEQTLRKYKLELSRY